jgi:hypothetical protein
MTIRYPSYRLTGRRETSLERQLLVGWLLLLLLLPNAGRLHGEEAGRSVGTSC